MIPSPQRVFIEEKSNWNQVNMWYATTTSGTQLLLESRLREESENESDLAVRLRRELELSVRACLTGDKTGAFQQRWAG